MKVVWQIMVFINYIKNLDLYHQGEYALRVSIQSERSGRRARFVSNPQVDCPSEAQEEPTSRFDTSRQAARISRDGCGYTTASCYIRFRDETVNLNDAIVFEVPVDVNKDFSTETLLLHFSLLYGKPVAHDSAASAAASRRPKTSGASATEPLEEVAVHSFRLNCGTRVLAGECLLLFDEMHRQVIAFSPQQILTRFPVLQMLRTRIRVRRACSPLPLPHWLLHARQSRRRRRRRGIASS
jgi:hypothetical protein